MSARARSRGAIFDADVAAREVADRDPEVRGGIEKEFGAVSCEGRPCAAFVNHQGVLFWVGTPPVFVTALVRLVYQLDRRRTLKATPSRRTSVRNHRT